MRFIVTYASAAMLFFMAFVSHEEIEAVLPVLPAEAVLVGTGGAGAFCTSDFLLSSLASRSFRWVSRPAKKNPVWPHNLGILCVEMPGNLVKMAVLADDKFIVQRDYQRRGGVDSDNVTARVIARLLPAEPAVIEAALGVFLANQSDVARLAADLWRARRWGEAADHLWLALENNWAPEAQANLHFALADSYAQMGRPRQAFWHALAYLQSSPNPPPAAWVKRLRGVSGLLAAQPANVEPQAEALARQWRQAAAAQHWDQAQAHLQRLCQQAPWAPEYQTAVAEIYERLGWKPLAEIWARRAAWTRELAADQALQARLAALTK